MLKKFFLSGMITLAGMGSFHATTAQTVRVHTIGDSTMADYAENTTRTRGWGEMLQSFFSPDVQVIDYARGGRSSRSFYEEGLWSRVKGNLRPDDYVLIQFAHNDEKEGGKDGADLRGTAPWTTYKSYLERYVDETRQLGGIPVFVTPIIRRYFDKNGNITPKGCHDLGIHPDDSTLNYVRVMKHVARHKHVPVVDMTSLTKAFAEQLGQEATTKQIYVPTDGTHTQATGAACYARIAADGLKRLGILANYIHTDIPLVFNPSSIDFGTVYIGDKAIQCIDVIGLQLSPTNGTLLLSAPEDMGFSTEPNASPQRSIALPYTEGKLWNQSLFLHYTPTHAGPLRAPLNISNGNITRQIMVNALGKEISQKTPIRITHFTIQQKGIVEQNSSYTIESGTWPADIDEDGKRYVEFVPHNAGKTLAIRQLSFIMQGNCCYRIAYGRGKDFYPRTDIGEAQRPVSGKQTYPLHITVNPNENLHIRFFPWNPKGGPMEFRIEQWQLQGMTIE